MKFVNVAVVLVVGTAATAVTAADANPNAKDQVVDNRIEMKVGANAVTEGLKYDYAAIAQAGNNVRFSLLKSPLNISIRNARESANASLDEEKNVLVALKTAIEASGNRESIQSDNFNEFIAKAGKLIDNEKLEWEYLKNVIEAVDETEFQGLRNKMDALKDEGNQAIRVLNEKCPGKSITNCVQANYDPTEDVKKVKKWLLASLLSGNASSEIAAYIKPDWKGVVRLIDPPVGVSSINAGRMNLYGGVGTLRKLKENVAALSDGDSSLRKLVIDAVTMNAKSIEEIGKRVGALERLAEAAVYRLQAEETPSDVGLSVKIVNMWLMAVQMFRSEKCAGDSDFKNCYLPPAPAPAPAPPAPTPSSKKSGGVFSFFKKSSTNN